MAMADPDDEGYDIPDEDGTPSISIVPDVFTPNGAAHSSGLTKRSVSVTVKRHMGTDKNAGPLVNNTVEVTLGEEGPMDFATAMKTAKVLCNEAVHIVAGSLNINTLEDNEGWVRFGSGPLPAAVAPTALYAAPQPPQMAPQGQPFPPPQYAPPQQYGAPQGQQNGGRSPGNYDQQTRSALVSLLGQQPHLFQAGQLTPMRDGKLKTPYLPSPQAFAVIGMPSPAEIKKLWV